MVAPLRGGGVLVLSAERPNAVPAGVANQRLNAHFRRLRVDLPARPRLPDGARPC